MKTAIKNRAKRVRARPRADDENGAQSGLYVRAVEKAFRVLKVFDGTQSHLSLSEISALTGLDISAAQRFTHTLAALDFLRRNEKTKKVRAFAAASRLRPSLHRVERDAHARASLPAAAWPRNGGSD
jgi:hypothetical protein